MRRPLLLLCILVVLYNAKSQTIPNFEQYTDDDGLSNGFVTCLYQDKMGFMWYGTANGVNRFDGYQFKSWTAVEGPSLPENSALEEATEHAFIQKIINTIEKDLSEQWEVPELAQALQVSPSQLHRKLTALTGMYTTESVRYVRLSKASKMLLAKPEENISGIAYEVGFPSPNEFNRRFKEVFGVTPGEWRNQKS